MCSDPCPTCGLITEPEGEPWHEGKHCPRWFTRPGNTGTTQAAAERDCLQLGLKRRDAEVARLRGYVSKSKELMGRVEQVLTDGAALIDVGEPLPRYQTPDMTIARIEQQDRENQTLRTRLAELGEKPSADSDVLLVTMLKGRVGGSPTLGHSRLKLANIIGQIRNGETFEGLRNCWGGYPDEFWRVCIALATELMPVPDDDEEADRG